MSRFIRCSPGVHRGSRHYAALLLPVLLMAPLPASARTSNGNDFALAYAEAEGPEARKSVLAEAVGRPHFFRYLHILTLTETEDGGRPAIHITALEPASLLDVRFTVNKTQSVALIRADPVSEPGQALAVTGRVITVDDKHGTIVIDPVIVRHKDRLSPAIGKELIGEVKPGSIFYTYTGGRKPVSLTFEDRDLLRDQQRILDEKGPQGWADHLEQALAKRRAEPTQGGKP